MKKFENSESVSPKKMRHHIGNDFSNFLCNYIQPCESDLQTIFQLIWINIVTVMGICIFYNFSFTSAKVLRGVTSVWFIAMNLLLGS